MKALNRKTPATRAPGDQAPSPRRLVTLTPAQAGHWLGYLERTANGQRPMAECLKQLHSELAEAAWLGRWKRETTQLELCSMLVAEIFSELAQLSQHNECKEDFQVLEEMLLVLCIDQR